MAVCRRFLAHLDVHEHTVQQRECLPPVVRHHHGYVSKPVQPDELFDVVERHRDPFLCRPTEYSVRLVDAAVAGR